METIKNALRDVGFTSEEVEVYIAVLEIGTASMLQIAEEVQIPRSTVYVIIDGLVQKGLLTYSARGNTKRVLPVPPEEILKIVEEKGKRIQDSFISLSLQMPQLQALYNTQVEKPKVRYYSAYEIASIFEEAANNDFMAIFGTSWTELRQFDDTLTPFYKRIAKRKVKTQEITGNSEQDNKHKNAYTSDFHQIISIDTKYLSRLFQIIYRNAVVYVTVKEDLTAFVLEDARLVQFEKNKFNLLWMMAKTGLLR